MQVLIDGDPTPFDVTEHWLEEQVLIPLLTYSTSLFAAKARTDPRPAYCGSATLVATGGRRCLLTAEHVWRAVQRYGDCLLFSVDQTLSPSRDLPMAIESLRYVEERFVAVRRSDEWGPDLALLGIPDLHADVAQTRKAFYDLDRRRARASTAEVSDTIGLWAVFGAPGTECYLSADGWDMQAYVLGSTIRDRHKRDGFDYLDLLIKRDGRPLPSSLGGLSGTGLWRCGLRRLANGNVECHGVALEGVAFYESREEVGFVRCHGRGSIERALKDG